MKYMFLKGAGNSALVARIAVLVYVAMLIYLAGIGYYLVPYIIFLLAFLIIVMNYSNLKIFQALRQNPLTQNLLFVFLLALLLRFMLLFQDQVITRDIEMYVQRADWLLAGKVPYEDFSVNKPPMYAYLLQFLGYSVGLAEISFRAFFSLIDSIVAVLIFYLCKCKYDADFSLKAAFTYAICPLPIVAIGLSGHYEPVVMVFVISSLILLFKNKFHISSIFLGLGFALKFFPVILLPFYAWRIKPWLRKINYSLLFGIPIILSIIPMLLSSPTGFWNYLFHQGYTWPAKKSFAFSYIVLSGSPDILGVKVSFIFTVLFLAIIFFLFISWVRKKFNATFWFKIIMISFIIYYGIFMTASIMFFRSDLGLTDPVPIMATFAIIYFPLIIFLFYKYKHHFELAVAKSEELYIVSAFALIFLIFGSSQFNPWYILWYLPFVLAIKNEKIRIILLWVIFWNFEGIGLSMLPGFAVG